MYALYVDNPVFGDAGSLLFTSNPPNTLGSTFTALNSFVVKKSNQRYLINSETEHTTLRPLAMNITLR